MKKIILTLLFVFSLSVTFGQNKWQMKKINYFVDSAAKEFNFDQKQKEEFLKLRTAYFLDYAAAFKEAKDKNLDKEAKRQLLGPINQRSIKDLAKISGKTIQELQPFLKRMRTEMKNVK